MGIKRRVVSLAALIACSGSLPLSGPIRSTDITYIRTLVGLAVSGGGY
ncbi:hypothetical protein LTSERUB_2107 [Salmonella enterica subsp. enterica serovar Rubislaw str. A4-653]|uniref:Uncharacterized protein n=1 Tax=Salmonella enterica subsp. enterica serovar Rubislaw str. A4-653 TaxID=913081 RepID=G5QHY2_SALRU|nr:hypothetical protein LTSERUB_2107 [Salmonella enterica subsp. enterica serovar Rubislaw str. A4-653]